MNIYIDNKIVNNIRYSLLNDGVDIDKTLEKCQISKSELIADNGRIYQNKLLKFHQAIKPIIFQHYSYFSTLSIKSLYQDYPELFSLCLNGETAHQAISTYINYYELMHNTLCIQEKKDLEYTEYYCLEYADFPLDFSVVLPTFLVLTQLMRMYISTPNIDIEFMDINLSSQIKMAISKQFKISCLWGKSAYKIRFNNLQLYQYNHHYNALLNQFQKRHLNQHYNTIFRYRGILSQQIINDIKNNINQSKCIDNISILNMICQKLNISRWTLNRRLHHEGTSFNTLVKQEKGHLAQQLLLDSPLTIQEISERLGFSSQSAFSRFFRMENGTTPMNFRQMHRS